MNLFDIVGSDFFKALTGKYQNIFMDCLEIIYSTYRTELSYGVDREIITRLNRFAQRFCRVFIPDAHIPLLHAYRWSNMSQECAA